MAHTIFHTKGIIIEHYPRGESDKTLRLYTRDFGMIYANVRSIRKIESRLRYSLQDYSFSYIDLVKGRDMWRLTSSESICSFFPRESLQQEVFFNIINLVKRLCIGESSNESLFDTLVDGFSLLFDTLDPKLLKNIEFIVVFRILYHSGYLNGDNEEIGILLKSPFSNIFINTVTSMRQKLLYSVNKSIQEIDI